MRTSVKSWNCPEIPKFPGKIRECQASHVTPFFSYIFVVFSYIFKAACGRFGFLKNFHNPAGQKNFHLTLRVTDSRFLQWQVFVSIENFRDGYHWCEGHADCATWLCNNFRSTNLKWVLELAMEIPTIVHPDHGLYPPRGSGSSILARV